MPGGPLARGRLPGHLVGGLLLQGGPRVLEGGEHGAARGVAVLRVLGQGSAQNGDEGERQRVGLGPVEGRLLLHVLSHGGPRRLGPEWDAADEELVDHDAQRVEVAAEIHPDPASHLFRAHVLRGAHRLVLAGQIRRPGAAELRDPEVHQTDDPLRVLHDVGGLEVTVDDARFMDGREPLAHLEGEVVSLFPREDSPLEQDALQVGPLHQRHGDVEPLAVVAVVVDGTHVLVPNLAGQLDLGAKTADQVVVGPRAQDLERDLLLEGAVVGSPHPPHPPLAEKAQDLVAGGDDRAGTEGRTHGRITESRPRYDRRRLRSNGP